MKKAVESYSFSDTSTVYGESRSVYPFSGEGLLALHCSMAPLGNVVAVEFSSSSDFSNPQYFELAPGYVEIVIPHGFSFFRLMRRDVSQRCSFIFFEGGDKDG